MRSKNLKPNLA